MRAIKATFDGKQIILPPDAQHGEPAEVIVVFNDAPDDSDRQAWLIAQQDALTKTWDNEEDAEYDQL